MSLDKVSSSCQPLRVGSTLLFMRVALRGDTRILSITEHDDSGKRADGSERPKLILVTALPGIGISLVRSGMRELAYLRLMHLEFNLKASSALTKAKVRLGDFRLRRAHLRARRRGGELLLLRDGELLLLRQGQLLLRTWLRQKSARPGKIDFEERAQRAAITFMRFSAL